MDNLYFDPVKVDTSLAEEYIQKKCPGFEELKPGTAWCFGEKKGVKILDEILEYLSYECDDLNQKLRNLSEKLNDNSELFSQLDYLLRKTDVDETRNCHLKLISQYLRLEEDPYWMTFNCIGRIVLKASTPLYYLGHVATIYRVAKIPILVCEKAIAPICQLFYELCLDVGLNMDLYCINNGDWEEIDCHITVPRAMGCTLAITAEADMDSAVDVFLNSSEEAPWRIERIYVQESVYEELMEVMEARCERVPSDSGSSRCVDAFRTERGRRVEAGVGAGGGGGVPLRAYRGARDLLALLSAGAGAGGAGTLSLWCGSAAAAHEVALAAPNVLVWIDHYAAFDGPPSASVPFYNVTCCNRHISESIHTRLLELQRPWIALPLDERKAIVLDVLKTASPGSEDDGLKITKLADGIAGWTPTADLVDIAPDRITMVIDRPLTVVCDDDYTLELFKLVIRGYPGVISQFLKFDLNIISALCDAGVPITKTKVNVSEEPEYTHKIIVKVIPSDYKVIHSRFGTIYSN